MKTKRTRFLSLSLSLLLILAGILMAGCDAKSNSVDAEIMDGYPSMGGGYDFPADDADKEEAVEGSTGSNGSTATPDAEYERKFIRTVTMACETKGYDDAISTVMAVLKANSGYVETSALSGTGYIDENGKGTPRKAVYTLRLPAEKLDTFLESLRTNDGIRVLSQNASSDEITGTYYDLQSRLKTLETERDALTAMLEGFTNYDDIDAMLRVQERLYNVIEEIEALKTRLNLYDDKVALSTVHLTIDEVLTYTVAAEPTFGERISKAFKDSWRDFADGCQDFAVWFVEALPALLVFFAITGGILWIVLGSVRRGNRRRAAKRAAMEAEKAKHTDGTAK